MRTLLIAALVAAAIPAGMETARDRQDAAALQKMVDQYAQAASKSPNDADAQYRVALAASYLAQVAQEVRNKPLAKSASERGIPAAEKAVALRPDAENYRVLGTLYGQAVTDLFSGLKYGPRAKAAIAKAVEKAPNSSAVYVARGVGNYYLPEQMGGGSRAAVEDFRKAIQLDAKNADAYLWLGVALRKEKKDAEARDAIGKSLKLAPNRLWAKQQLDKTPK